MLRNVGEQCDDRGGAGNNGLPRGHSVRDRERGRENLRGVEEEEEEDVMSIILAGPYGEVRHALASTSALASCILSRLATVACLADREYLIIAA